MSWSEVLCEWVSGGQSDVPWDDELNIGFIKMLCSVYLLISLIRCLSDLRDDLAANFCRLHCHLPTITLAIQTTSANSYFGSVILVFPGKNDAPETENENTSQHMK